MCLIEFQRGGADKEAFELKDKILSSKDPEIGDGTVYYFSENGNDCYDGLSIEAPKKTYTEISKIPLKAGDKVLFERNGIFRTPDKIMLQSGVYYGAYGNGEKPKIYGSLRNYADASIWKRYNDEHIYCTPISQLEVGMINFENDKMIGVWKRDLSKLLSDGDFYFDAEKGILYLYMEKGNPGEVFDSIEIATTMCFANAGPAENITIENICFKYATFGPFVMSNVNNIHITNCEMGWHGGRVFCERDGDIIRYGNAVEFWYRCKDIKVDNCYIYQIFDAALTFQGYHDGQPRFENIVFSNNLIEYCSMNIEYWAGQNGDKESPFISNISVKNNMIRFAGYGWGGKQRADKMGQAMLLGWNYSYDNMHNFVISENVLDCADCFMIKLNLPKYQDGLIVFGNTFYQKETSGLHEYVQVIDGLDIVAHCQEDLERAINEFDSNPKLVKWLK